MKDIHESVTSERVCELIAQDDNVGLCLDCGSERFNTEPDARNYHCEECNGNRVFGVEQILIEIPLP